MLNWTRSYVWHDTLKDNLVDERTWYHQFSRKWKLEYQIWWNFIAEEKKNKDLIASCGLVVETGIYVEAHSFVFQLRQTKARSVPYVLMIRVIQVWFARVIARTFVVCLTGRRPILNRLGHCIYVRRHCRLSWSILLCESAFCVRIGRIRFRSISIDSISIPLGSVEYWSVLFSPCAILVNFVLRIWRKKSIYIKTFPCPSPEFFRRGSSVLLWSRTPFISLSSSSSSLLLPSLDPVSPPHLSSPASSSSA